MKILHFYAPNCNFNTIFLVFYDYLKDLYMIFICILGMTFFFMNICFKGKNILYFLGMYQIDVKDILKTFEP